jgi:predicted dehydrogenase
MPSIVPGRKQGYEPVGVGIIGYGNWGPRLARALAENAELHAICEPRPEGRAKAQMRHAGARVTADVDDLLGDPQIDGICIATPVGTHEALTRAVLEAGKDVLVEKPLAHSVEAARRCVDLADRLGRVLMVGHTFVYSPPVRALRHLVEDGVLGRLYYASSERVNLGLFQKDVSVVWDLAPHDLSILLYATGEEPAAIAAHGKAFVGAGNLEDAASITVEFASGAVAYVHVSWIAPVKLRKTTLIGAKTMLVYDDVEPVERVKIYDRGVQLREIDPTFGEFQLSYRVGDVHSPVVGSEEPLSLEIQAFCAAIQTRKAPESDGRFGLRVVEILEAASQSIRDGGRLVTLGR